MLVTIVAKACGIILHKRLTQHIIGLIDSATILILDEIIIHTHHSGIIEIGGHNHLLGEEWRYIIILHPEERIFCHAIAKVIGTTHDRA